MCHRGLPRLKLKVENSFILFFLTTKKLLDDGRHEEACGDQAGGEKQQGHGAASDDGLGQGSINGLREMAKLFCSF